jgi:hypothetical protein
VVWDEHFNDLCNNVKLTIVDGIIGQVLASREASRRFAEGFQPREKGWDQESFNALDPSTQHDIVQDWVLDVEVQSELDIDPIANAAARLMWELDVNGFRCEPKTLPELNWIAPVHERLEEFFSVLCVGSRVTIETPDFGPLHRTVMLPNFKTPGFGIGLQLAEHIAQVILCEKLHELRVAKKESAPVGS